MVRVLSPPQSQSKAVVCVSTPRMYPRSGYFLVIHTPIFLYITSFFLSGSFLYLLGQPRSDVANFTDKRVISELIRETGNNCTVSLTMNYDKIEGAMVEFGTQNLAKAYSAIKILTFTKDNSTSYQK